MIACRCLECDREYLDARPYGDQCAACRALEDRAYHVEPFENLSWHSRRAELRERLSVAGNLDQ